MNFYNIKQLSIALLISFIIVACSDDPSINGPYMPSEDLFLREDAASTLIPLQLNNNWNYVVTKTSIEKPVCPLRSLLENDTIQYIRLLPVRNYDNNEGWGKYEYQTLCYITKNNVVYSYLSDKIYIGRYLQSDNFGFESVMWDYELPSYYTENSSRYFILIRNSSSLNMDEDYLHEMPGYYTLYVKKTDPLDTRTFEGCKLFQFQNKRDNVSDPIQINKFYFKQGIGLIRYQQTILSPTDSTELELYEQDLIVD